MGTATQNHSLLYGSIDKFHSKCYIWQLTQIFLCAVGLLKLKTKIFPMFGISVEMISKNASVWRYFFILYFHYSTVTWIKSRVLQIHVHISKCYGSSLL